MLFLKIVAHFLMMKIILMFINLLKMLVEIFSKKASTHIKKHHPMSQKEKKETPLSCR